MRSDNPLLHESKGCTKCGVSKPLSEFHAYAYTTTGGVLSQRCESRCKNCKKAHRNLEAEATARRAWCRRHPDRQREYGRTQRSKPTAKARKSKLQAMRKACQRAQTPYKNCPKVAEIYAEARRLRDAGIEVHVDHIYPLKLGGLHVVENLQIIPAKLNMQKGAKPHFAITEDFRCQL